MWWTGMIIMILGELCNFGAYAFVEAIIVVSTPLHALVPSTPVPTTFFRLQWERSPS